MRRLLLLPACALALLASALAGDGPATAPARTIAYRGYLPYCSGDNGPSGDFEVEFLLYETPQKGVVRWREKQKVHAEKGRVAVDLGAREPIPPELYTATFRWVGIRIDGAKELTPRLPVVNTLWVHADGAAPAQQAAPEGSAPPPCAEGLARVGGLCVERSARPAATWAEADAEARKLGRRLPSRDEWLAALRLMKAQGLEDMTGHYEWTEPWLFDPTDGSEEIRLYSGKLNGCSFEELSPELNKYRFRLVEAPKPAR